MQKQKVFFLFSLIVIVLLVLLPLFRNGFYQTDDGEWMIIRFSAFHQSLRDGQFPVRFLTRLNHGYGYPVANFLYPGFMYLAEPFHILGAGFVDSIKIVLGLSTLGSALFTFLWLQKRFTPLSSFIGACCALFVPYRFYDLYFRGSVGELLAIALVPFILWQIERRSFFWSSLATAFLILSHNTLAVLFLPLILVYRLFLLEKMRIKSVIVDIIPFLVATLGLSVFFWLPALFELQYTVFSSVKVSNFVEYFASPQMLGSALLVLTGLSIFLISQLKKDTQENRLFLYFLVITILTITVSNAISTPFWENVPVSFIQFPFRVLSYVCISVAFLAAFSVQYFQRTAKYLVIFILLALSLFSSAAYVQPQNYFDKGEGFYSTNADTTTVKNEYMPMWVKEIPVKQPDALVTAGQHGNIRNILQRTNYIRFEVNSTEKEYVEVARIFYPGWTVRVNNTPVTIDYQNSKGMIRFQIPAGNSNVVVQFIETPIRMIANSISVVSFILLVLLQLPYRKNVFRTQKT